MAAETRSLALPDVGPGGGRLPARPDDTALGPYLRALRAHIVIAILVLLATVGSGIAYLSVRSDTYQTDAELLISPIDTGNQALVTLPIVRETGDPTRTIQTAAELVDSHDAAELTARRLGADWTRSAVESSTDVSPQGQTNIIEITATAGDPELAARLANTFADSVLESRRELLRPLARRELAGVTQRLAQIGDRQGQAAGELEIARTQLQGIQDGTDPSISLSQRAVAPSAPIGTPPWIVVALAFVAGLVLATATALLIGILSPERITSEEELLRIYPLPILSRVPKLPRGRRRPQAGTLDLDPIVREAFRTLQLQLELKGSRRRAIMIGSASRGDGKTTAAASFALELADSGATVIAIDADLRKPDLGAALGVQPGIAAVDEAHAPKDAPNDPLKPVPGREAMWLLDLQDIRQLEGADRYGRRMKGLITGMLNAVDYVVVDTPPIGEVSDALTILDEVDDVILVSRPGNTRRLSLEIARDLFDRSGVEPTGFVIVGGQSTGGRYPYGNP